MSMTVCFVGLVAAQETRDLPFQEHKNFRYGTPTKRIMEPSLSRTFASGNESLYFRRV